MTDISEILKVNMANMALELPLGYLLRRCSNIKDYAQFQRRLSHDVFLVKWNMCAGYHFERHSVKSFRYLTTTKWQWLPDTEISRDSLARLHLPLKVENERKNS